MTVTQKKCKHLVYMMGNIREGWMCTNENCKKYSKDLEPKADFKVTHCNKKGCEYFKPE